MRTIHRGSSPMRALLLFAGLALLTGSAPAQDGSASESRDSWHWRLAPYLWTTSIDGTLSTPISEVVVEAEFDDIWDNLDSAGLILVEAQRGQLSLLGDFIYMGLEADGTGPLGAPASAELDTTIVELAGLYQLSPTSPLALGGGLRYAEFETGIEAGMLSSSGGRDAFDGFVAGRVAWPLAQSLSLQVYGDIGTGDSDLTWQASATIGWMFDGWGLGVGYRVLDYEVDGGPTEVDLTFQGLVYGIEFRF